MASKREQSIRHAVQFFAFFLICSLFLAQSEAAQKPRARIWSKGSGPEDLPPRLHPDDEKKSDPPAFPCTFTIDPRWQQWSTNWSTNAFLLKEKAAEAEKRNDFIERQRNLSKLAYGTVFWKYHDERFSTNSPAGKILVKLTADRDDLLRQKGVQEKFQNAEAVAKLDQQIQHNAIQLKKAQTLVSPLPSSEIFGLLVRHMMNYGPRTFDTVPIIQVAFAPMSPGAYPLVEGSYPMELSRCREQVAKQASLPGTPKEVLDQAFALNSKLKQIQDDLVGGRISQAKVQAQLVWKELLE